MKLMVEMLDDYRTDYALHMHGECVPYGRRVVQVKLTEDQAALLQPRNVGTHGMNEVLEFRGNVWLED